MTEGQSPSQPILCKYFDPNKEHIIDREGDIFDPILYISDMDKLKENILEESIVVWDEFNLCESILVHFCLPHVYHFSKFVC